MVRIEIYSRDGGVNRAGFPGLTVPENARCIGSACMMWRWRISQDPATKNNGMWPTAEPKYIVSETEGFCGLAGAYGGA